MNVSFCVFREDLIPVNCLQKLYIRPVYKPICKLTEMATQNYTWHSNTICRGSMLRQLLFSTEIYISPEIGRLAGLSLGRGGGSGGGDSGFGLQAKIYNSINMQQHPTYRVTQTTS